MLQEDQMHRYAKFWTVVFGLLLAVLVALWLTTRHDRHFAQLVVDSPGDLTLTFLIEEQRDRDHCLQTAAAMASTALATCPQCRIESSQCFGTLNDTQALYLSDAPISTAAARLVNGTIIYHSSNPQLAQAACQESERISVRQADPVRCDQAGKVRSRPKQPLGTRLIELFLHPLTFTALATAFLGLLGYLALQTSNRKIPHALQLWPRRLKQALMAASDVVAIEFSLWLAFSLRLESFYVPRDESALIFLVAPVIAIPVFIRLGLYHAIIRYLGLQALVAVSLAVFAYVTILGIGIYVAAPPGIPRSITLIQGALLLMMIGGTRLIARECFHNLEVEASDVNGRKNVLIYGAGAAGMQLATALSLSRELRPAAFVDDDPALHGHTLGGHKVHHPKELPRLIETQRVEEVLLAIPSASRTRRNEIIAALEPYPVHVRTIPRLADLAQGKIRIEDLREVEIEDLLGRDPVPPVSCLLRANITGKVVMVTGAGGSIGSELCRQIHSLQPAALVLFERNEFALYSIEQELLRREPPVDTAIYPLLGSVTDQARIERTIRRYGIQTIFHAAAYKHVPMVEKNPGEGVFNNVFGTHRTAVAALNCGVETFVLISTDKAVRPTNTMGTTKRVAEMLLQALAERFPERTRFTMVRFGNVLGSSGSVVPLFREQIRKGGPITVTDPRIIRYFMTIPEAAQLVIQAGAMGRDGDVFVLDMGEPVKILDLAHRMIHLSGLTVKDKENPDGDIDVVFSGLRPGEKLYEELLIGDKVAATEHPRIRRACEKMLPLDEVQMLLDRLLAAYTAGDSDRIRELLREAVSEFSPQCENGDLLKA